MKTTVGKLRNITTGRLHTDIGGVYEFVEEYTGEKGIMTHHLPSACPVLQDILRTKIDSSWFVDEWIKDGNDEEVDIPDLTKEEKENFFEEFEKREMMFKQSWIRNVKRVFPIFSDTEVEDLYHKIKPYDRAQNASLSVDDAVNRIVGNA